MAVDYREVKLQLDDTPTSSPSYFAKVDNGDHQLRLEDGSLKVTATQRAIITP